MTKFRSNLIKYWLIQILVQSIWAALCRIGGSNIQFLFSSESLSMARKHVGSSLPLPILKWLHQRLLLISRDTHIGTGVSLGYVYLLLGWCYAGAGYPAIHALAYEVSRTTHHRGCMMFISNSEKGKSGERIFQKLLTVNKTMNDQCCTNVVQLLSSSYIISFSKGYCIAFFSSFILFFFNMIVLGTFKTRVCVHSANAGKQYNWKTVQRSNFKAMLHFNTQKMYCISKLWLLPNSI